MNENIQTPLYIVDVQRHFEKPANTSIDNSYEFEKIVENLKKNYKKYNEIILIVDEHYHGVDSSEELIYSYHEDHSHEFQDIEEFYEFADRNSELLENNVYFPLIQAIDKLIQNGEIPKRPVIKKEHGSLRLMMDYHIDKMVYMIELKRELGYRDLETGMQESEFIKDLIEHLQEEESIDKEELQDLLENGEFDNAEYAGGEYNSELARKSEITICGGGAMECLLEEYINITVGSNVEKINIQTDMIYGDKHSFISAAETIKEQMEMIKKLKEQKKIKEVKISKTKEI